MKALNIEAIGGLLGLPFREVYDYLKGVKETREVQRQLGNVLQSLNLYKTSSEASEKSGQALLAKVDSLKPPISMQDAKDLTRVWIESSNGFADVLSSIRVFGNECNDLISGDFEAFLQRVKARKPIAHDFLTFFGRNYNPRTGSLDLTKLPMLLRIYGPKIGWKESKEMSRKVDDGRKVVSRALEKTRAIIRQRHLPRINDRQLVRDYVRSLRRLAKEVKSFQSTGKVDRELWRNAPSWFVNMIDIGEKVQTALPDLYRPAIVAYRRHRPVGRVQALERAIGS